MAANQHYKIDIPHFYCLTYEEGDHCLTIDVDFRDPQPILYCDSIKHWDPPYESEIIDDIKRKDICDKIHNYFTNRGMGRVIIRN